MCNSDISGVENKVNVIGLIVACLHIDVIQQPELSLIKLTPMIQSYMSQHLLPLFWLYLRRYKSIVVCYNYVIAVRVFPLQRLQLHCIQRPCIIDLFLCVNRFLTSFLKQQILKIENNYLLTKLCLHSSLYLHLFS